MNLVLKIMTIAMFTSLLASDVFAQNLYVNGVTFTLGESEASARADIQSSEMTISKEGFLRVKRGELYELCGSVVFKGGKVVAVQRDWFLNQTPDDKNVVANAFHDAMVSVLDGKDSAMCSLNVKEQGVGPDFGKLRSTTIRCYTPKWNHILILSGADCSGGCSEKVSASLTEIISEKDMLF